MGVLEPLFTAPRGAISVLEKPPYLHEMLDAHISKINSKQSTRRGQLRVKKQYMQKRIRWTKHHSKNNSTNLIKQAN